MKKTWKPSAGMILTEGVPLVGLAWLLSLDRTDLIIRFGIRQADSLLPILWSLWAVLTLGLNLWLYLRWRKRIKRQNAQPIKLTFAPDKVLSPAEIRAELIRFQSDRPQLKLLLEQGLDQLDNITRKKEKMREILDRNDVHLLSEASGALNDAEQTLCRKLVLVLNRALLCDPEEENAHRRETVYEEHARAIQVFLGENEDVLNRCETLLTETVHYVEEKKAGHESMNLQLMTDVIRSLTNDGIRMNV